jgi:phage tail-like protein
MSSTSAPAPPPAPPPAATTQPSFLSSHFVVQLGTGAQTPVTIVSGLEADTPVVLANEGASLASDEKEPGQPSYPNLVLTRPLTRDLTLWQWMQSSLTGAVAKRDISVTLLDSQHNPVIQWAFRNAFPVRWAGPALNALSNDIAMETLELAHEGLTVTAP